VLELDLYLHIFLSHRFPTEEEAHSTDLRECVDERGSERADAKCQSCSWKEPARTHFLAQDVQGNLENDVRDVEHAQDCVVVCAVVSFGPPVSKRS
jgi:hypothetical protein